MTKKLGVSLLAIVLIVCMLSVGLFACNKDKPESGDSVELQAVKAIVGGVQKSVEDGDMKDLKVDATLGLNVNDKTEYKIKLALDLDLLQYHDWTYTPLASTAKFDANAEYYKKNQKNEYERAYVASYDFDDVKSTLYTKARKNAETDKQTNSWIDAEIIEVKKDGTATNKTLLGLYFSDKPSTTESKYAGVSDIYQGNTLYVQANTADGQKKMAFPAPFIGGVQAALDGQVDFSGIDLTDEEIWDSLDEYLGIVASLAQDGVCTSTKAAITLNVGKLLDSDPDNEYSLITLVKGLQGYLDALGLDLKATDLGTFLPNIALTLSADLEDGKVTGIDISLGLDKKNMNLKTIDKSTDPATKKDFLVVKMDENVQLTISLDYAIGTATKFRPSDLNTYKKQGNVLDAKISADLHLGEKLAIEVAGYKIGIDPGDYTLSAQIAANPWEILAHIKEYNFDGISNIISSITTMLQGIDCVDLHIINKANRTDVLRLVVGHEYEKPDDVYVTDGSIFAFVSTTIISQGDEPLELGMNLDELLTFVQNIISGTAKKGGYAPDDKHPVDPYTPSVNPPASDLSTAAAEDATTKLLKTIGGYLLGAYIGINDGTNGDIFAKFDSSKTASGLIPFSWYTEWKGGATDKFDIYEKATSDKYTAVASDAKYDKDTKYFVWVPETFNRVDTVAKAWDKYLAYFTRTNIGTETEPVYQYTDKTFADEEEYKAFDEPIYTYQGGYWSEKSFEKATDFKPATETYYTRTAETFTKVTNPDWDDENKTYYVKGAAEEGGDFGIGLKAELKIDNGNISIEATVENANITGFLPETINVGLSNINISLFNCDYTVIIPNPDDATAAAHPYVAVLLSSLNK
jgi:hypothetical protein